MKKDTKKTNTLPATLWLESLSDFAQHAQEIDAQRIYLSVSNQPAQTRLVPTTEGEFSILATARTAQTILQYAQAVQTVSHVDAFVRREDTERAIQVQVETMSTELEKLGFTVKKGKWTL